ncbi:Protein of unknown function [Pyronema omphalodes CBS 100304]|uniref:Uncharacterized protein n=1 Tax=Pyronema omphalodes (strain CBS 100304) TaxID=1076935 RepID=U4L1K0_PYROM|nr:Protein of unknown function [Pyronema omphalodes CBS 100304]
MAPHNPGITLPLQHTHYQHCFPSLGNSRQRTTESIHVEANGNCSISILIPGEFVPVENRFEEKSREAVESGSESDPNSDSEVVQKFLEKSK